MYYILYMTPLKKRTAETRREPMQMLPREGPAARAKAGRTGDVGLSGVYHQAATVPTTVQRRRD